MLRDVGWYLVTDVSAQRISPISKDQAVQEEYRKHTDEWTYMGRCKRWLVLGEVKTPIKLPKPRKRALTTVCSLHTTVHASVSRSTWADRPLGTDTLSRNVGKLTHHTAQQTRSAKTRPTDISEAQFYISSSHIPNTPFTVFGTLRNYRSTSTVHRGGSLKSSICRL